MRMEMTVRSAGGVKKRRHILRDCPNKDKDQGDALFIGMSMDRRVQRLSERQGSMNQARAAQWG